MIFNRALLLLFFIISVCLFTLSNHAFGSEKLIPFSLDNPVGPQFSAAQKIAQANAGKGIIPLVMKAYNAGAASVRIPPGNYRFGQEIYGPDGPIFPLEFKDLNRPDGKPLTIDGSGVTLWFALADDQLPTAHFALGIKNCSNIVFKNFTLDRATRGNIEGKITRIDSENNRIEIRISKGIAMPTSYSGGLEQRIIPFKSDGSFIAPLYTLQAGGLHMKYKSVTPGTEPGRCWVEMLDDSLLKKNQDPDWIKSYGAGGTLAVGDGLALVYAGAISISVVNSRKISMDGINDYITKSCPSETGGYGAHLWKNCYFGPRPGTNQWQGGEGFMCNATRHGSTFDNVTIKNTTDDAMNIHGYWGYIKSIEGSQVTFQKSYYFPPDGIIPGDNILFYDRDTAKPLGGAQIIAVNDKTLSLDKPASSFANGIAVLPEHECAGWVIQNCNWTDIYQRLLIQSGPGIVRNCSFTRLGHGISLESVFFTDNEGGIAHDILIQGNKFTNVDPQPHSSSISMYMVTYKAPTVNLFDKISVHGNTFTNPGEAAIAFDHVTNGTITSNIINNALRYTVVADPSVAGTKQPVMLFNCNGISLSGNTLNDPGNYTSINPLTHSRLLNLGKGCSNIRLDGKNIAER